jgi:hypothetical protein
MLRQGGSVVWSLVTERQLPALHSVTVLVFNRGNTTVAATQATPEEWECAKPFEDIPGPKPLPVIGNAWRFIPYIGNVFYLVDLSRYYSKEKGVSVCFVSDITEQILMELGTRSLYQNCWAYSILVHIGSKQDWKGRWMSSGLLRRVVW